MPAERDPASELLDRGARTLLARAYGVRSGTWVMTRLADPSPAHVAWGIGIGLDPLLGPDRPPTANGSHVQAHTRWGRAFMRSLYFQHRWYGDKPRKGFRPERRMTPYSLPLQVEWGRRVPAVGVIPAGRAVRVRIAVGGQTARRVVRAKPDSARIFADNGAIAGRWSDPARRDWLGYQPFGAGFGDLPGGEVAEVMLMDRAGSLLLAELGIVGARLGVW